MYEQKRHKEHEDKQKNPAPAVAAAKKGKDAVLVSKNRGGNLSADQKPTKMWQVRFFILWCLVVFLLISQKIF